MNRLGRSRRSRTVLLAGVLGWIVATAAGAVDPDWIAAHEARMEGLFAALDGEQPALAPIVADWRAGRGRDACEGLVDYFRHRPDPLPGLAPTLELRADAVFRADAFLAGRYDPLGERVELATRSGGGLDWEQRGPTGDKEFAWMLNRLLFLTDLVPAARATGDPRYLAAVDRVLADWIQANPYPNRLSFSPAWRALEVARRLLDAWGPYFSTFCGSGQIADETLLLLLSSIPDHADALEEHASSWGGNHLVTEKAALALAGLQWPEFAGAARWRTDGAAIATREILAQTYPDGAYMELSNHYERVVLTNAQYLADLFTLAGQPVPDALRERLEAMWTHFAGVMKPDGWGPLNNAADREFNASLVEATARRLGRDDWLYQATGGEEGTPPADPPERLFRWSGQAIFRDDWSSAGNWAFFDFGPRGTAHAHDDRLHLSVVLDGRDFLVDPGRYTYQPGVWKDFFTGPRAHNVATLEGYDRRAAPRAWTAPEGAFLLQSETASAVAGEQWFDAAHTPRGRVWRQRRVILFLRSEGLVVVDQLVGFGPVHATFRWHFAPGLEREDIRNRFHFAGNPVALEETWTLGSPNPVGGWTSPQYGEKHEAWQLDLRAALEGPRVFVWMIGTEPATAARVTQGVVELDAGDGHWRIDPEALTVEASR